MGASDSTCCGSHTSESLNKLDTDTTSVKQNRRLHHFSRSQTPPTESEGESTPVPGDPTSKIVKALKMYRSQATELNASYQQQYAGLIQCLIDQIATEANIDPPNIQSTPSKALTSETSKPIAHKTKKMSYNRISTQIEILNSEGLKAQSLLLCIKRSNIDEEKEYGFLPFLRHDLDDESVDELFNKFPDATSLTATQFVSLLTLTVIIYKIRTAHLLTRSSSEAYRTPHIDGEKVKVSVQHLSVWIIRRFGCKLNKSKTIHVVDDMGNPIDGRYYAYKLEINKQQYSQNICLWIQQYVHREGVFDSSSDLELIHE
eukprot:12561_1